MNAHIWESINLINQQLHFIFTYLIDTFVPRDINFRSFQFSLFLHELGLGPNGKMAQGPNGDISLPAMEFE